MRLRLDKEIVIPLSQIQMLLKLVQTAFPREASGIILEQELSQSRLLSFIETSTKENTPFTFCIRDLEIKRIAQIINGSGKLICGCFHSHIFGSPKPSIHDIATKKEQGDLWLIYSVKYSDLKIFKWERDTFCNQPFRISKQ